MSGEGIQSLDLLAVVAHQGCPDLLASGAVHDPERSGVGMRHVPVAPLHERDERCGEVLAPLGQLVLVPGALGAVAVGHAREQAVVHHAREPFGQTFRDTPSWPCMSSKRPTP